MQEKEPQKHCEKATIIDAAQCDKNSKNLLQQQKCQNMDRFYYNLASIQDQAQLSSSNRLEMAKI